MTPAQRAAERAQQLAQDPLLNAAICAMRDSCYHAIERSEVLDVDTREDYYKLLKVCLMFEAELKAYINRGKLDTLSTHGEVNRLIR